MVFVLKDLRDQLYYVTYHESTNVFRSLVAYGKYLPQKKQKKSPPKKYKNDTRTNRTESEGDFPRDKKKWSLEEIHALENEKDIGKIAHSVASILKSLDFGPILTRERVTGISENLLDKEMDHCIKVCPVDFVMLSYRYCWVNFFSFLDLRVKTENARN